MKYNFKQQEKEKEIKHNNQFTGIPVIPSVTWKNDYVDRGWKVTSRLKYWKFENCVVKRNSDLTHLTHL